VAQKNQQCTIVEMATELGVTAIQIQQRKLVNADVFHGLEKCPRSEAKLVWRLLDKKKGRPDLAPLLIN
jgi:hypothetical protein